MTRSLRIGVLAVAAATVALADYSGYAAEGNKQAVFLICPHHKKYSAWSLFLTVDSSDPSKVLSFGLEKLVGKNSEDLAPNGYEAVLATQEAPQTPRELLGTLAAKDLGGHELRIEKDDALHASLKALDADSYRLYVSMRIGADERFVIGGKEEKKRDVILRYDRTKGRWKAYAVALLDFEGNKVVSQGAKVLSGICFPVGAGGISLIVGDLEGQAVTLLDNSKRHSEP